LTNNESYLGNGARQEVSYYYSHAESQVAYLLYIGTGITGDDKTFGT